MGSHTQNFFIFGFADYKRLKNIIEKEIILNQTEIFLKEANSFLTQWKKQQKEYKLLLDYYYSEQWQKDFFASNEGKIPKNIPHGVLSEDSIYNTLIKQKELAIKYLKFITKILEE